MIGITVALPLWESKDIAWLCLESLCRQRDAISWELIVVEEQSENMLGREGLMSYGAVLSKAGCDAIKYIPLKDRFPLLKKWAMAARDADKESNAFVLCAGDNFYQPYLLRDTGLSIIHGKHDWAQSYQCHFYDIDTQKLVEYRRIKRTGIEMSIKMSLARKIPYFNEWSGVDLKIMSALNPRSVYWNDADWCLNTVCTHGRNKISGSRRGILINRTRAPFRPCQHKLDELLPEEICNRLRTL